MNHKLDVVPEAIQEVAEAFDWYCEQQPELGDRFERAVESTVARVAEQPFLCAVRPTGKRHALVAKFPYVVVYEIINNTVRVLAVTHTRRTPDYWKHR